MQSHHLQWSIIFLVLALLTLPGCGGGGDSEGNNNGGGDQEVQISGTVTGLSSGSVAIKNRDGTPVDVASDGSFSLSAQSNSGYNIQIDRNPIEQLCRVENGSAGSVSGNVSNIRIICESVAQAPTCSGDADSDGDNLRDCEELQRYGTNPWLADTDGDTLTDNEEVVVFDPNNNTFRFNPRIADMPTIAIDLASLPEILLDFTESNGSSRSVATAHDITQTSGISRDWGGETSRQLEVGHTLSVSTTNTVGTEVSVSPTDLGASVSYEASLTVGFESSVSQSWGSSVNWSNTQTSENSRAYSESLDISETSGTSFNGGRLSVAARIRNNGHIPYDLENLTLSAVLFDPRRPFDVQPIGNLEFTAGGFPLTTVLPGESAPLNFSTDLLLPVAQRLLRDSRNIVIQPATFRLLDINDRSLLLAERDVAARTATVVIDHGISGGREDKYRVAINNGDGSKAISVMTALSDILKLSVTQGAGQWTYGNDSSAKATPQGLLSVRNVSMSSSANQYWMLAHNRNNQASAGERVTDVYNLLQEAYDLNSILLRAGDKLTLVYVGDSDRDALPDRSEREFGTDPDLIDTDTDTLTDATEVYGWLTNLTGQPCDVGDSLIRVFGNPLSDDSDGDGIKDAVEKDACSNPNFDFIVDAGINQVARRLSSVTLNATLTSTVPNQAFYSWRLISGPDVDDGTGPTRELVGRSPSFTTPDDVSTLLFELEVSIDTQTQTDQVRIQVLQDPAKAVFVGANATGGSPDGTPDNPYRSLTEALSFINQGDDLYVMSQATPYMLTDTLIIPDGSSLFGGYDGNWVRNIGTNPTALIRETSIDMEPAVRIEQASSEMWFSGFAVTARNVSSNASNSIVAMQIMPTRQQAGPVFVTDNILTGDHVASGASSNPGSSYALMVKELATLRLRDNTFIAGHGGSGIAGGTGSRGGVGVNGGKGGSGGAGPSGGGGSGAIGKSSDGFTGGKGGSGAGGCKNASGNSNRGKQGRDGTTPASRHGAGGGLFAHNLEDGYLPADGTAGGRGEHGTGGGGGGGGGGCGFAGGGNGGGGGKAGAGGTGGAGGAGGGASIALLIHNVSNAEIRANTITADNGGIGGNSGGGGSRGIGGGGGSGKAGGTFGNCNILCDRGGAGASGGRGGHGGTGGRGGAGSGGPSFGVYVGAGVAPIFSDNVITSSNGGNGGRNGHSGSGGHSYAIYDADLSDGQTPDLIAGSNQLSVGTAGVSGTPSSGRTRGTEGVAGMSNF
jgi:hypothetical protein